MDAYRRNRKAILLFLLPALFIYTCLTMLPILASFGFAFTSWHGITGEAIKYAGISNFTKLLKDEFFWISLKNIALFMVLTLDIQIPVGFVAALLLSKGLKFSKMFRTIIFLPQIVSITATSLIWYFILLPNDGVLTTLLTMIGFGEYARNWLVDSHTAMVSIILVNAWIGVGFHMTVFSAAIAGIPKDIEDAAQIDGVTGLKRIVSIIIPLVWESMKICVIIVVTAVLKAFDVVFVMTQGGPNGLTQVPTTLLYDQAFRYDNYGIASAISILIFLLSISITILSLKILQRDTLEY
ncbi:carbohydrate ABC transporter permease [Paenibacillus roseipurpureus]|uniref:Sugar ABC transporter permease n=1 Tax=Paenibacillus roseopurpureus TaxID=2918901 RepID=A0AA96RJ77_9BACL|nr:sugar ABC transporter permease [Paenibacillus sp. MBLB1832]WNR42861.1 sugar ABC transporter permease [Paenibacillus sp. MBLB1832]